MKKENELKYKPFIGMKIKQLKSCRFKEPSKTAPEFGNGEIMRITNISKTKEGHDRVTIKVNPNR